MNFGMKLDSPLGPLWLESDGEALTGLRMEPGAGEGEICPVLLQAQSWLEDYFQGCPREIDFPLAPEGTPFQRGVWAQLLTIPWGQTRTYGSIARGMERKPMSAQAVGGAVGRNPIAIVIPCHRVIGANGSLTGFAWGLDKKEWLLKHEKASPAGEAVTSPRTGD